MDRREIIKWMLAAAASLPGLQKAVRSSSLPASLVTTYESAGYGADPKLLKVYTPGELWPLTFTPEQCRMAAVLSDLIIPADTHSRSASQVGVVDFLDEWVSAPYESQREDRQIILKGFEWLDKESMKRFSKIFVAIDATQQRAICDDICYLPKAARRFIDAAKFFTRYRDLTAGGFYTTPEGRKDLQYVGNTPLPHFEGPPPEVLKRVGLASS